MFVLFFGINIVYCSFCFPYDSFLKSNLLIIYLYIKHNFENISFSIQFFFSAYMSKSKHEKRMFA